MQMVNRDRMATNVAWTWIKTNISTGAPDSPAGGCGAPVSVGGTRKCVLRFVDQSETQKSQNAVVRASLLTCSMPCTSPENPLMALHMCCAGSRLCASSNAFPSAVHVFITTPPSTTSPANERPLPTPPCPRDCWRPPTSGPQLIFIISLSIPALFMYYIYFCISPLHVTQYLET